MSNKYGVYVNIFDEPNSLEVSVHNEVSQDLAREDEIGVPAYLKVLIVRLHRARLGTTAGAALASEAAWFVAENFGMPIVWALDGATEVDLDAAWNNGFGAAKKGMNLPLEKLWDEFYKGFKGFLDLLEGQSEESGYGDYDLGVNTKNVFSDMEGYGDTSEKTFSDHDKLTDDDLITYDKDYTMQALDRMDSISEIGKTYA